MVRVHIFFSGTVQGVGFRYTCRDYAVGLGLKGWVKNLPDGRVELLVSGSQELTAQMITRIEEHFDGYIRDKVVNSQEVVEQFSDFRIVT